MLKLLCYGLFCFVTFTTIGHADTRAGGSSTTPDNITVHGNTEPVSRTPSVASPNTNGSTTCPSRTANYITHTLPQQCLRTDRIAANATNSLQAKPQSWSVNDTHETVSQLAPPENASRTPTPNSLVDSTASETIASSEALTATTSEAASVVAATSSTIVTSSLARGITSESGAETDSLFDSANFLSFEEWKKQNVGRVPEQGRNLPVDGDRRRPGINNALDALGDEGEIEIDFSGFGGAASGPSQHQAAYRSADGATPDQEVPTSQTSRSKDAGKTCKERTNYASFDCAATILKHNAECKSTSSILVENKDSYMLNTCSANNKYFIVELCNDILVDTVVLANYEFFSSIFRHFRVSVSDRYPVKSDKWIDLGTFEARNTREVQAFLIEHPQIWARYLRIEFLTHYGSEYYCPISLLRVHGTTMLEEIRPQEEVRPGEVAEAEAIPDAEAEAVAPNSQKTELPTDKVGREVSQAAVNASAMRSEQQTATSTESSMSRAGSTNGSEPALPTSRPLSDDGSSADLLSNLTSPDSAMTCASNETSTSVTMPETTDAAVGNSSRWHTGHGDEANSSVTGPSADKNLTSEQSRTSEAPNATMPSAAETRLNNSTTTESTATGEKAREHSTATASSAMQNSKLHTSDTAEDTIRVAPSSPTNSTRSPTNAASVAHPQPSTQESFFKSIHKRLQQLESNSTLSLQYIEEQSRILRDAFSKVEKRQISATTTFLANLNATVMAELHGFRQAYDQLWQSTVIELEGQREQYQQEMLALSTRLTLVADELVWQKRMGIVQSTLLLLCLGLVLFARSGNGYLEVPLMQNMMHKSQIALSRAGWESPPASPDSRSPVSLFRRKLWRSVTEPMADNITDDTDSRPATKDGVVVNLEPPTPPARNELSDSDFESVTENDEIEGTMLDIRRTKSVPSMANAVEESTAQPHDVLHVDPSNTEVEVV